MKDPNATVTQTGNRGVSIQHGRLPDGSDGWTLVQWRYSLIDAPEEWSRIEIIFLSEREMEEIAGRVLASRRKVKKF